MNEILTTLNDVEADIQSIRDAENYLNLQQQNGGEFSKSNREQIKAEHAADQRNTEKRTNKRSANWKTS